MWPYDPGFPNEQWALYQTIRRAREALSVVLRVVALAVAPPSRVVNMVNGHEDEEMTLLGEDDSKCLLISIYNFFFASSWFPDITVPHHCQPM